MTQLSAVIESFLIASSDGLSSAQILEFLQARYSAAHEELEQATEKEKETLQEEIEGLREISIEQIEGFIGELNTYYTSAARSFHIVDTAFGWKIYTNPEMAPYLEHLYPTPRASKLSQPALETLAIIAYRQPVTKASIESVRGVSSDGMVQKLLEAELIETSGRADLPGRPRLYSTTAFFFEHFGVKSIEDLPNSAELRNMAWPTQEQAKEEDDPQMQLGEFHQRQLEEQQDEE